MNNQSLHWTDKIAIGIQKWQEKNNIKNLHVDDMKTPSGRVHTGSLRGVILHDLIAKTLTEKTNEKVSSTYVFNDMDPMNNLPRYLNKEDYDVHMGKPLYKIPTPELNKSGIDFKNASKAEVEEFKNAKSFGEFYAIDFIHAFRKLGCDQKIIWSHELYESGKMDEQIKTALNKVESIKKIYKEIADYDLPNNWYPFQVICEKCGKVGTTLTTSWDGKKVTYECQLDKVKWAKGCGYKGEISPFGGTGKLLWKVDWPAHWKTMGVTIEGAGKDHNSASGSRDMADAQLKKVFDYPLLFNIPYEWILIRGAKMSSSKGVGTSAREFVNLFPPQVGRFLFASKNYNQVIDFDPQGETIPDLYDEYNQAARIFWDQEKGDKRMGRAFELSQIGKIPKSEFLPRFRDVALWMQYPELNLVSEFEKIKGSSLTDIEKNTLEITKKYAQIWIDRYSPNEFQLTASESTPIESVTLNTDQLSYLEEAIKLVNSREWPDPQNLQQELFNLSKKGIGAKQAFQSIYLAFLGKTYGPRAAWFLLNTNKKILNSRISDIEKLKKSKEKEDFLFDIFDQPEIFSIDKNFEEKYPSATIGIAIMDGVNIEKINKELEKEKESLINNVKDLTPKEVQDNKEINSYRKMYEEMGIDWNKRKSSPAALLIRASQGKGIANINTCVDAYNLVVMKNRISAGAFDFDQFEFPTILKEAKGGENIKVIGENDPIELKKGEVCYFDQNGPYNMDYNFRDAKRTSVTKDTKKLLINVEGINSISREQVEKSLKEVIDIIQKYCGGEVITAGIVKAKK